MISWKDRVEMAWGLEQMLGAVFESVSGQVNSEEIIFQTVAGERWVFAHDQDCCETVTVNDITGDLTDLVGSPLLLAEEFSGSIPADHDDADYDSYTYTYYRFATQRGRVTVRWLGTSNGYYSESVDLYLTLEP